MEAEESDREKLPAGPVALATALSGLLTVLLFSPFFASVPFQGDPREAAGMSAILLFAGLGPACLIGVPIALLLLRDPRRPAPIWAAAGSATGVLAVAIVGFWVCGTDLPMMIFTEAGDLVFAIVAAAAVIGAVSGLVARLLLWWFLSIRKD
jgi:hypothetical protein